VRATGAMGPNAGLGLGHGLGLGSREEALSHLRGRSRLASRAQYDGALMQWISILFVVAFMGGYYAWYFNKVKKAGGYVGIAQRIVQSKFGLLPGEATPTFEWTGEIYIGDLVPGSGPTTMEKIGGALASTSYRGRVLAVTITSTNRLVIAAEPAEGSDVKADASLGDLGYRPLLAFTPSDRPRFVEPTDAFAGNPKLAKELKSAPERHNRMAQTVKLQLGVLQTTRGQPLAFWCESDGLARIRSWCANGV